MLGSILEELDGSLGRRIEELEVVVMPDFFLDRLVTVNCDVETFSGAVRKVVERKGGSIDGIRQSELKGGNAINTASALTALGVTVTPIVCTSKLGLNMIKFHFERFGVDLSHIKIFGNISITTAIEFENGNGKANVMLRDVGSLADFGPHHLDNEDFNAIRKADYVCIFNWAGTRLFGTELAEKVFRSVKHAGRGRTYYDTADPTPVREYVPKLIRNVLQSRCIDILSVNESEAICYASQLSDETTRFKNLGLSDLAKESARILASRLPLRVDLHTADFSATFMGKRETIVPIFKVNALRTTGAGDAWNAGNILGDALDLSDESRLALANAVAAYYITSLEAVHPSRRQLTEFCRKLTQRHN